ncbi:hypothetical protein PVNG_03849 [Plasmodium vivax North Korean]|uniref:Uncharacterized protein n=1 Tax=Plasmodium vivax North Korean TaxID=1035514 RepID=A0A0J9TSV9_PLAVI|nr:hypothetical protein PVNG_03849 [Plasmodium vivax North Korean]
MRYSVYVILKNTIFYIFFYILYLLFLYLFSQKDDIDNLTSKYTYSSFERGEEGCEKLDFYSNIRDDFNDSYQMYNIHSISDKILKALCFIYNKKLIHQGNFNKELCSYLYYWLGDKIYPIVHDKTVFSKIIKMIYDELSRTIMFRTCTPLHENIDENIFNIYKLLFDYSIDHYHINLNTVNPNTTCDEYYKEAIDKYINTYNDVYFHCTQGDQKKYDCEHFNTLFQNYEHKKLRSFHCTHHKAQSLSTHAKLFGEQTKHSSHETRGSEGNTALVGIPVSQRNNGQYGRQSPQENPGLSVHNVLGSALSHNTNNITEGGSSKTIAGSVVPVLGVSSISLLLYKVNRNIIETHSIIIYV